MASTIGQQKAGVETSALSPTQRLKLLWMFSAGREQ